MVYFQVLSSYLPQNTSHKHYNLSKLAHFFQWCVCVCDGQNVLFLAENKTSILKNKLMVKSETITCCVLIYLMCLVQNVEHSVKNATLSLLIP
jgi:hypothetical protein